jgi:alpha-galactosidase
MKLIPTFLALSTPFFGQTFAAEKQPLKVFILAGQSNMEGHATLPTIDFLGEDTDPARAAL